MPGRDLRLLFDLPSLGFSLGLEISGLPAHHALHAALEARWPPLPPGAQPSGVLAFEAVPGAVGLPSAELVTAEVSWSTPDQAEILTNAAAFSLDLRGPRLEARGRLDADRARGALEAAVRAVTVLALARRGVLVLHASAVHRAGDALVFLGASTAGKTTTARRLGREGLRRLADDMLAIDLAAVPPTLHRLPFERAGRALPELASGSPPVTCLGGALVRKHAAAPGLEPLPDPARVWAEAVITLPPAPARAPELLEHLVRLCRLPLRALAAPPAGPLAPTALAWLDALRAEVEARRPGKDLDTPPRAPQAAPPGGPMNERIQPDKRVTRAPNVAWRVLDGAAVLVAPSSPAIQTLNPVGTLIWSLADGRPLPDIVDAVVNEFDVDRTQASLDVEHFVRDLEGKGLLVAASPPVGS